MPSDRIFISYSHADRPIAERLAHSLLDQGQDVWWDQWEVAVGDSLIKKIFSEGIANASAFIILLSKSSVNSKWVQEELDSATVRRIEDLTRVIPALVEDVPIPMPLRTLKWVDLWKDFEGSVRDIVNAVNRITSKPVLGPPPRHIVDRFPQMESLSRLASLVGRYLLDQNDPDSSDDRALSGNDLVDALAITPQEVNDAVDELEDSGLITVLKALGTHPFDFLAIEPTYLLFMFGADQLPYDPQLDIRQVLAAVASLSTTDGKQLSQQTSLTPGRLNRAVEYLRDQGLIEVTRFLGTHPFTFGFVRSTRRTRQAVDNS